MAMPPWNVEMLRRGVADLAKQVSDPEAAAALKQQAAELVEELPKKASGKVREVLKFAADTEDSSSSPTHPRKAEDWFREGRFLLAETLRAGGGLFSSDHDGSESTALLKTKTVINASGTLMHPSGSGLTIPETVIAAGLPAFDGTLRPSTALTQLLRNRITDLLAPTGKRDALSVALFPSLRAACGQLGAAIGRDGSVLLARRDARLISSLGNQRLVDLFRQFQIPVHEIGGIDGVRPEDLAGLFQQTPPVSGWIHLATGTFDAAISEALEQPAWSDLLKVSLLPRSVPLLPVSKDPTLPTMQGSLEGDFDAYVMPIGALASMPDAAILIGPKHLIAQIDELHGGEPFESTAAGLALTLSMTEAVQRYAGEASPLARLLTASEDNLSDRAERLATQLSQLPGVTNVQVTAESARFSGEDDDSAEISSRQVRLLATEAWCNDQHQRLAAGSMAVIAGRNGDSLVFDLRWVSPDQQTELASLVRQRLA